MRTKVDKAVEGWKDGERIKKRRHTEGRKKR